MSAVPLSDDLIHDAWSRPGRWPGGLHAVVPVKTLAQAKRRLAPLLDAPARRALSLAMLADILARLRRSPVIASLTVVTADAEVAALAAAAGAALLRQPADRGLSAAVAAAARHLAAAGAGNLLYLPADVPLLAEADLRALWRSGGGAPSVTLVPAHDGLGTNALLCRPPDILPFAFEGASCARHLALARARGLPAELLALPGPALDIDRPDDLARLGARLGARPDDCLHTAGLLRHPPEPANLPPAEAARGA